MKGYTFSKRASNNNVSLFKALKDVAGISEVVLGYTGVDRTLPRSSAVYEKELQLRP